RNFGRARGAEVALPRAAVDGGVAVEQFPPDAPPRSAEVIIVARHRREVERDEHVVVGDLPLAQEADHPLLVVAAIDPLDAGLFAIAVMQGWLGPIDRIEIA